MDCLLPHGAISILQAHGVINATRIYVSLEIGTGEHVGGDRQVFVTHAILIISKPEKMGYPADSKFRQHDFQARQTVKDTIVDSLGQETLHRMMEDRRGGNVE